MASVSPSTSPRWDARNQPFVSPTQLQSWKRDAELHQHLQQRSTPGEFGQVASFPSSPPLPPPTSFQPFPSQQQQTMPLLPEIRRTMSGQSGATGSSPAHTRTISSFSLFSRRSHTMDNQKDTPTSPPSSFHKQSASVPVAEAGKAHNVLTRRTSNGTKPDQTIPSNNNINNSNGHSNSEPVNSPATSQPPPTPMSPTTPASPAKPPPQLHPEIRSIVQLTSAHAQKVYFSGPMVRKVERQPDGQKPAKDEGWRNVWAQLGGTTLSLWDMKEIEEASKQGKQVPPSYVNVTDAVSIPKNA